MYDFKTKLTFSKDGGLDELIALDRYAVSTADPDALRIGDTVVFIADELKGTRLVGEITAASNMGPGFNIKARNGETYNVRPELITKPLETEPTQMWERWAYGAALTERDLYGGDLESWQDEFLWLFDGFRYSPGGRVQLGLGHEYLGLPKAPLTLTNCFVLPVPKGADDAPTQWANVIDTVLTEMQISRRGGGVGINISEIRTVPGAHDVDVTLYLPEDHPDYAELRRMVKLHKFDGVTVVSDRGHFVYDVVQDSIEGHIGALRRMVEDVNQGYSVWLDFSDIRPRNAVVKGVNGRSSGAAAWMELFALVSRLLRQPEIDAVDFAEIFSFVINLIQQGGSRRGALMLVCNDNHPCVEKFIERKRVMGFLQGANISVGLSDSFMDRVKEYKANSREGFGSVGDVAQAGRLWNMIIEAAWSSAEPGVIWLERYNRMSNSRYFATIVATNPCGEQGLPENGACNLGHHVLPGFVKGDWMRGQGYVDWDELARAVRLGTRFQDLMVDYGLFPTEETKQQQMLERRVGMGTMGLGTMLIMLGLRYGTAEADAFLDELYSFIAFHAYDASIDLARQKGPFPAFDYDKYVRSGFVQNMLRKYPQLVEKLQMFGIRNVTLLTQAPTGSTGTMIDQIPGMNCSTGIEPYFAFTYWRAGRLGVYEQEVDLVKEWKDANPGADLPHYFVTAQDLRPEDHVRVQGIIQRWVDSSISKTANAPNSYTIEDTDALYMQAYDEGCKGMTIYRDGCRDAQVLSTTKEGAKLEAHIEADKIKEMEAQEVIQVSKTVTVEVEDKHEHKITKRPGRLFGFTEKIKVAVGDQLTKVYVTINVDTDNGLPVEVFVQANHTDLKPTAEALGRMVTQFLRFGCTQDNVEQTIKHLRHGQHYGTLPWWVAHLLEGVVYGKIEFPGAKKQAPKAGVMLKCADCGEMAYDKTNCICHACGSSKCN